MKIVKVLVVVAVIAVAGVLFYGSRQTGAAEPSANDAAMLAVAEKRNLEIAAEAAGLVEPVRIVEVKSKASGEVLRVLVETGQVVKQGDLLAEIDPRDVQSALEQAVAELDAARVRANTTEAQRKRMETLRESGVVTQTEYESAVDAAASARSAVVRTETALRLAKERRGDVTIRAPSTGTILSRSVEPGIIIASATNNISGGTALFQMADLTEMQVRAKFDETDIGQISVGQTATVSVEAYPQRKFVGKVAKIEPQAVVEQNVTLFPVLIRLDNKDGLLRPGMNGEVQVQIASRRNAVTVPNSAVLPAREARSVASVLGVEEEQIQAAVRALSSAAAPGGEVKQDDTCSQLRTKLREAGGPSGLSATELASFKECREKAQRERELEASAPVGTPRPGVVFIQSAAGIEPRGVTMGLSDWENTEVISGLNPGEQVILVTVAQAQRSQQEMQDRFRQRAGGIVPGAGGGGKRGGR